MDYGHDLSFGTFITPQAQQPEAVVALAQLTEQAGLDLATFQDHPYQASFLDTWTLLSWVAAQTTTLKVAPNVLNLPLRRPAVIARSAASLDLLSGGRVELGLGAGAFWDAIAAMGGPNLTPGQSVDALSEAIDVIRGIWDPPTPAERGGVWVEGEHHQVRGAKRGPEPAHDIGVWLGAYKPRMLRLTGRKADGWLPSLMYMELDQLGPANTVIDEAAEAAGRDPREIRRLLNLQGAFTADRRGFLQGPPEQWVEELLPLVLDQGFSTFLLAGDDPRSIEVFGLQVAPALREAVAAERREAGTPIGAVRGSRAIALRSEGIDYDAVPESLAGGKAVEPGDRGYSKVRSTYIHSGSPGLVLRPENVAEVQEALAYAREQDVPFTIRSGGHGISGRSTNDGGIVIDLAALNGIEVLDPQTGRIRLGPAARWGDVARELAPYGLAMSSGDYGDVGVGGLATVGGIGFLGRRFGLTIDHVVAAELVLADGTFVRADAERHPDLLWAVRGAGPNFGVVTALELEAYPLSDVVFSTMAFDASATSRLLEEYGRIIEEAPRELTSFLHLGAGRGAPIAQLHSVFASDDTDAAIRALTPLLGLGPVLDQQAQLVPYHVVVPPHGGVHVGGGSPAFRSGLAEHITPEMARTLTRGIHDGRIPMLQIRPVGGAVNDVDPMATAYAHRTQNFSVSAVGNARRLDPLWDEIRPHFSGLYLNFETDPRPERLHDAYPGETLERLRELKARYDPEGVFGQSFAIPPAGRPAATMRRGIAPGSPRG